MGIWMNINEPMHTRGNGWDFSMDNDSYSWSDIKKSQFELV